MSLYYSLCYLQISKQQADSYRDGQLPECHLNIKYVGSPLESDFPLKLDYTVELQGAIKPFNYFRIRQRIHGGLLIIQLYNPLPRQHL